MIFRETLKNVRERAGLEQKDLAERVGVTKSAISGWESGYRRPSATNLARLLTVDILQENERDILLHAYHKDIVQSLHTLGYRNGMRNAQLQEALRLNSGQITP